MKCFLLLLMPLFLTACAAAAPVERSLFAMDTLMSIRIWGGEDAPDAVSDELTRLDSLLSATDASSEIYHLNQAGQAALSDEVAALLKKCCALSERTNGCFDPTIYPLVCAYGFPTDAYRVPQAEELSALLETVGTAHLHFTGNTVALDSGSQLDLGAVGKGYAAEACAELLDELGVQAALLQLGGNVQTVGTKPDGSDWAIGIADPNEPTQAIGVLRFTGSLAVITSGAYQRFFEEDGVRYHHILDPRTGVCAENGLASVTILAESGTLADALSTALFVMGLEEASEFWRASDDFEAVFVTEAGAVFATTGAADRLTDCDFTVIAR